MTTQQLLEQAAAHRRCAAALSTAQRAAALEQMARALESAQAGILAANEQDLAAARGSVSDVMLDRLALTPSRLTDMAKGMREVAALPDPVGAVLRKIVRPNGLLIEKTAVPMGVIAIIYESRPNVTSDAAALAIKAGSACILRCGRDAWASCHAIVEALRAGLRRDIVIADWQYTIVSDSVWQSARLFREAGFDVICCSFSNQANYQTALNTIRAAGCMGFMKTTWHTLGRQIAHLVYAGDLMWHGREVMSLSKTCSRAMDVFRKMLPCHDYAGAGWSSIQIGPGANILS